MDILAVWQAMFESRPAVQMQHRWFAYGLLIAGLVLSWKLWKSPAGLKGLAPGLAALLSLQVILGILTLVNAAPLWLSLLHQAGAIALFLKACVISWRTSQPVA